MIRLWEKDIPGYDEKLDKTIPGIMPYLVESDKKHGAVIVIPGGAYGMKAPHEGEPIARWLNKIGLSAFVLDYRVSPYEYPYPIIDGKRAVRYVRYNAKKWNIAEDKIAVLGFSAGGHLASTLGTHFDYGDKNSNDAIERVSCRPDAMILCYPVITFRKYTNYDTLYNLLGKTPDKELVNSLSNENSVTENTPSSFLWHTSDDEGVNVENSLMFASALKKYEIPFELHIFPNGSHGLGLAEEYPNIATWTKLCEQWLLGMNFMEQPDK